ncbi:MAG: DUF721 domain-containing protein [Proteobacteria bacterium]|nr:DUF721 domain-containing protein [Pseudomonadota bacterium]
MKRKREKNPRTRVVRAAHFAVGDVLRLYGITEQVRAGRLVTEWNDLVGDRIASRTRPVGVTDRVLYVEVATSAWMQELTLMRVKLTMGLLARFGEPRMFDELKFRLAGRTRGDSLAPRAARRGAPAPHVMPMPATGEAREAILADAAHVDDPELRELIARVRIAHAK